MGWTELQVPTLVLFMDWTRTKLGLFNDFLEKKIFYKMIDPNIGQALFWYT